MTVAMVTDNPSYLLPCRHCGEPVAVRTGSGRLRALGEFTVTKEGRLLIVCPTCQRDTRTSGALYADSKPR